MNSPLKFKAPITVHTPAGDLPGLFEGLTDTPGVACVTIYRDRCPEAFRQAHKSAMPNMFVSLKDVEAG